jgi:muconolactone delta-isomerase
MTTARPQPGLRSPAEVMRLARMGSAHPTRLSFMRQLLRRISREGWQVDRPVWDLDARGVGRAVYRARGPYRTYSLVAFAHDLPDHLRSDRVIAEAWDATFALFDGEPTEADLDRLEANVPKQEAGRMSGRELTLSRANRSVRLFGHVVDALSAGRQPDRSELASVGYLMRTTAVYGSAKFGLSDRAAISGRPELMAPFQAEMLTVWLIRAFTVDIAEHMAASLSPDAVRLDPDLRRTLGVGNSTGLGMAPFLLNRPVLIHHWFHAREAALARVRGATVTDSDLHAFRTALSGARANAASWASEHPVQQRKLSDLRADLDQLSSYLDGTDLIAPGTWDDLWLWGVENLSLEGQEQLLSLLLEPHGALIDDLADTMHTDEEDVAVVDGRQSVSDLRAQIEQDYKWALETDWSDHTQIARLWYVSAEKLEPRLAERAEEPLSDYEQALAPGRDVADLYEALTTLPDVAPVAELLLACPEHRYAVRRVQTVAAHPYSEVRDNTIHADMLPIDLLRAKLSFFGATRFDPRSDRWVRISMFQNAPFPDEMPSEKADSWMWTA